MGKEISIVIKAYNQTKRAFAEVGKGLRDVFRGNFGKGFGEIGAGLKQFGATALGIVGKVGAGLAKMAGYAAAASAAVIAVGKKALDAYKSQAQADAKLEQALKNSGYAAGFTATELKKMAGDLQKTTGIADDATESVMALIATSGDIRGDNYKRATLAALDMGTALKKAGAEEGGVEAAAAALAKALESPSDGLTKLTRAGIHFTDEQEKQIKAMEAAGDLAGAQAVILSEVERRYKGAAEAAHKQTAAQDDLRNSLGDAAEQVGQAITESQGFRDIIGAVADAVKRLTESGKIELWAQNVATLMATVGKAVLPIVKLFGWIGDKTRDMAAFAGGFVGAQGGLGERWQAGHQAMMDAPAQEAAALEAIKAEKARKAAAKEAEERAAMAAAKPEVAARDAAKLKAIEDAKAAKEAEQAAKDREAALKREADLAKDINDERERAAKLEEEIAKESLRVRWDKQLEAATEAADKIGAALEQREAMGAPGSKQFARAASEERRQEKARARFVRERNELRRLDPLAAEDVAGMTEAQRAAELRRVKIMQRLGLTREQDSTPEAIAARAKRLGVHLSQRDVEAIRRAEALDQMRAAKAQAAVAQANIKGGLEVQQAADIKAMKDELAQHNKKLDELLRAG